MFVNMLGTLVVICIALGVTYVAGAIGLVIATFAALLLICYIDPNGLAR